IPTLAARVRDDTDGESVIPGRAQSAEPRSSMRSAKRFALPSQDRCPSPQSLPLPVTPPPPLSSTSGRCDRVPPGRRARFSRPLATLSRCQQTMWTNRTKSFGFALAISAVAAGAVLPSQASAQQAEARFADSWFWGVRAGGMSVQTNVQDEFAPMGGLEWLIT